MIRSMDTLKRSVAILQKRQENISANVANTNTYGYKAQQILQTTLKAQPMHNYLKGSKLDQRNEIGNFVFGNEIDGTYRNFEQGALNSTERSTDFAIEGNGFFNVELANGQTAYTRNGNFKLNELNELVTQDGYPVLNQAGQRIQKNEVPDFQITSFRNTNPLVSMGSTLFTSTETGENDTNSIVKQGCLEASTVDMTDEMVNLIQTGREFESNQKAIQAADETLKKTVNEIGKV